ncbi:hypothetical protein PTI45_02718 [Paenibacillus nuruki]|uniref:Uncharacterized protein n=1 Tax=Paenibacillus nuruki TaxID=1886670 RepID=A0A1E3L276_9BACL|nr:YxiJ family protein [Paenibacillus nuruki]ODP27899.1 hypothetical protein PTI45_02718 [Paenibacillus nuruki]
MKELIAKLDHIHAYYKNLIDQDESIYYITELHEEFADEFKKYAPNEIFNADLSTYTSYIEPTCWSGTIQQRIQDAENRYTMKKWLSKSFFEWFPKYSFLEKYDLSDYSKINNELNYMNELRSCALQIIATYEQSLANKYI